MQINKNLFTATLLTIGGFAAVSANAAEATSNFGVSTTVESICKVVTPPLDVTFDNVAAGQATNDVKGSTSLTLNCSKGDLATISLTPRSSNSTNGTGYMLGGIGNAEKVSYKLTSDAAGSTPWGAAEDNKIGLPAATSYATDIVTPIYLTMTSSADVTPGTYNDVINISVAY